ncbi:uncharacterized protein LOC135825974 [Sycon ciliatum]|uniref:uncharacterized protein LOC135825974 n=1 Tax=Sycon ciliatum TaxID=27933 RepID=UPI0031F720FB
MQPLLVAVGILVQFLVLAASPVHSQAAGTVGIAANILWDSVSITAMPYGKRSIRLQWMMSDANINATSDGYSAVCSQVEDSSSFSEIPVPDISAGGVPSSVTVGGLRPGQNYSCSFRLRSSAKVLTSSVYATTVEEVPSQAPVIANLTVPSTSSVHVQWKNIPTHSINGQLRGYRITFAATQCTGCSCSAKSCFAVGADIIRTNTSRSSHVLKGLYANVDYVVRVQTFNGVGRGPLSAPETVLTALPVKSGANVFDLKHAYIYGGIVLGLIVALAVPAMVYSLCRNRDTRKSEPQQLGQLIKMPSAMSCAASNFDLPVTSRSFTNLIGAQVHVPGLDDVASGSRILYQGSPVASPLPLHPQRTDWPQMHHMPAEEGLETFGKKVEHDYDIPEMLIAKAAARMSAADPTNAAPHSPVPQAAELSSSFVPIPFEEGVVTVPDPTEPQPNI